MTAIIHWHAQLCKICADHSNNNDSNNINIYRAVIMAKPLQEYTRFIRWMQPIYRHPPDKGNQLRLWVRLLAATIYMHRWHLLLLAWRLILILPSHRG